MAVGSSMNGEESRFAKLKAAASGGAFALASEYQSDTDPHKVDLIIGAYRDDNGQPWQLASVKEAKQRLGIQSLSHEYLPLQGNAAFLDAAQELVFGPQNVEEHKSYIASIQTVSGTGANSLIAAFLQRHGKLKNIWLPDPTWANHADIWRENAPGVRVQWYPYYDSSTKTLNLPGLIHELQTKAEVGDAILVHACAHNPTGIDPTEDQWQQIALLCRAKKLFVIFDLAYQGFASGDLDVDAWAVRHFFARGIELAVCQSFSKNLGLYGERTGALHVAVLRNARSLPAAVVEEHLVNIHRATVSMAPLFGSMIATEILTNDNLREMWKADLLTMSGRVTEMRMALYDQLLLLKTPGNWNHIIEQTGMFSYLGLSSEDVTRLRKAHHVYMLPCGRASVCGLTTANVGYVAEAIYQVVTRKR